MSDKADKCGHREDMPKDHKPTVRETRIKREMIWLMLEREDCERIERIEVPVFKPEK